MSASPAFGRLGKYRTIVAAVAFFLVFDMAVLMLNFYTSYQISADAVAINLAGRQRMLSQRISKSMLLIERDMAEGLTDGEALKELSQASGLFSKTLTAFKHGGTVTGGDGKPVAIAAVPSATGQALIDEALSIWHPWERSISSLSASSTPEQLAQAVALTRSNNLAILGKMNALTSDLEAIATAKADRLRAVQTGGIILALLNFAFILFKFVRQLSASDQRTEEAKKETDEILDTVGDGLFLVDAKGQIGGQFSAALSGILRREVTRGTSLYDLLGQMLPADTVNTTKEYLDLLFRDRVRENLVASLNPLTEVKIHSAEQTNHYLSFRFNRVQKDGRIQHLLVTVQDVTERVELAHALESAKAQGRMEMEILHKLLQVPPSTMVFFLQETERVLLDLNDRLKGLSGSEAQNRRHLHTAFRQVHALKGDAAVLGLDLFENLSHELEKALALVREQAQPGGDELLALAVRLDEYFERLGMVRNIVDQMTAWRSHTASPDQKHFSSQLTQLAARIAQQQNKEVHVQAELEQLQTLPESIAGELRDIAVQLLRNSVTHGIEAPAERSDQGKSSVGQIQISCVASKNGYEFILRDDGRGVSPQAIRQALVRSGRYSEEQLAELDDRQIVMKIFEPGFSTATETTRDAGHGVGLDVVKERIQRLGGQLRISTRPAQFTEFRIQFAV